MSELSEGQNAPAFDLPNDTGGTISLEGLGGQKIILFFYPRDDTSSCTKEAIGFTGAATEFAAAGAVVLGVSKDTVAKHAKFRTKHDLGIPLLSDSDGDVCERYGTWVEKNMYGRKYMGIERATFLIDETGKIAQIWRRVKVHGHVDAVLAATQAS